MKNQNQYTPVVSRAVWRLAAIIICGLAITQSSSASLLHHWSFNTDGTDSVGGANVTLVGGATISGGSLNLPGGGVFTDYATVNLTGTMTTNATLSVECWFTQNALVNWSKVWMFGADNAGGEPALAYIDFTPYTGLANNVPKIDFDPNDVNELNAPGGGASTLSAGVQYHAVTVYDAANNLMSMWINGVLVSTNGMGGESVLNVGYTTARFGSGFFYADGGLNGTVNDIRIFNHATGPVQIAVDFAAGPDTVPSSYIPTTVYLNVGSTNLLGGQTESGNVTADFGSLLGVPVTAGVTNWSSSNPGVVTVDSSGLLTAVGAGNATISAKVAGVTGSVIVYVAAVQPSISQDLQPLTVFAGSPVTLSVGALGGNLTYFWYKNTVLIPNQTNSTLTFAAIALTDAGNYSVVASNVVGTASSSTVAVTVLQQSLDHRYSFTSDVTDSIAGANGTVINNVTFAGGAAVFPGVNASGPTGDYIQLPAGLVSSYVSVTLEMWATIQPNGNWNQICSFGDQSGTAGNTYLAVIPHSGAGDYRMTIRSLSVERATSGATPLDTSTPVHIVAVFNADTGNEILYANGVQVSKLATTIDIANVNNQNSWLGRSLFDGDAGLKGSIDEFRVWNGPLSPLQIAVNDGLGPNTVNTNAGAFIGLASISVANNPMVGGTSQQATALANFANVSGVPLNTLVTNWTSANTNVATVTAKGVITATGQGSSLISATALGSTTSVTINVLAVQPTISQQPAPQTRYLGSSALFSVTAAGGQLSYQWRKTGAPVSNATNSVFALTGLAAGDAADYTVVVTNSAGSITSSIAHLTVSAIPAGYAGTVMGDGPVSFWRLDESSGTTLIDAWGLNNGTYSGAFTLGTNGLINGSADTAVSFAGGTATVPFNTNLNPNTFTVEFWAKPTTFAASYAIALQDRTAGRRGYAIQFDNNTGGNGYWEFTYGTNAAGAFAVVDSRPLSLILGNTYHVVATYDGATAKIYVNGTLINSAAAPSYAGATATPPALTIASRNGNNVAGATIDEAAIYNYALTPAQIASHFALGQSGTLAATIVGGPTPGNFQSVVGLPHSFNAVVSGQSPLTVQWLKNGAPIPSATASKLTLLSLQSSDAGSYSFVASNSFGPVTSSPAVLSVVNNPFVVHRWSFNDGTDSVSGSNVTLVGAASYSGGQLVLPGGASHRDYATVNIAPTFASSPSLTFEGWYTDNAGLNWAKVWMFGYYSTSDYIDYTPRRGDANHQASMSFNPFNGEVNTANLAFEPPVLTPGNVYHVVAAYDSVGNKMNLYLNGALVATNNMKGTDLTQIVATNGLIGESLFGDPDFSGTVDEMRVWRGVLSAAQVAAMDAAGPSTIPDLNVSLGASKSGGNFVITWSSGTLLNATNLGGPWTPVAGASPPSYSVPISSGPVNFYRVKVQ